jgi:hypothetical protein
MREAAYVSAPSVFNVLNRNICIFLMTGEKDHDLRLVFRKWGLKNTRGSADGLENNIHYVGGHERRPVVNVIKFSRSVA